MDDLDPCELLSSSELSRLGAPAQGEAEELAGVRHCDWRVEKSSAAASYTLSVQVLGKVGLADVNGTGKQDIEVGSHKGVRSTRPSGVACVVSIEVAEKARVDVVVTGGEAASRCGPAEEAAGFVEPRLP
ncbi:hypothetical protein BJP25_30230 [Actinokineospora bangkokensis]|uniref:DUF3558 domain-containing protein n=1 Tax=Actinokineospora bangkokensis TaxID=1193682 RepID=A0A1Q9LFQ2_9PSEU|nr:hypothetical protein BJP25_30230 [Actinokineospora bangkokensis]